MWDDRLRDATGLVGVGLLGYGAWLWWPPAGFMMAGALMVALAVAGTVLRARR